MKILQIGSSLYDWGGIERYVAYLAEGLIARGHEVHIACPPSSPLAQRAPGHKLPVPLRFQFSYWLLPKFAKLLKEGRYDVAHVHFSPDFVIPLLAARMAKIPRVVMTRHVALPWPKSKVRRYAGKVDRIVCVSEAVLRALRDSGVETGKLVVAKAGCPPLEPNRSADTSKAMREGDNFVVGYFGRLVADKGVQVLVQAVKGISQGVATHFFGDGPMRNELEGMAGDAPIRFHGFVTDVADWMSAADIVAIPSVWAEAFPFSALEAMSLGKAIVASRRGGLPELVEDGQTGILVEGEDVMGLRAAIEMLRDAPEIAREMGERGRRAHSERYTVEAFAQRIEEVYSGIEPS